MKKFLALLLAAMMTTPWKSWRKPIPTFSWS